MCYEDHEEDEDDEICKGTSITHFGSVVTEVEKVWMDNRRKPPGWYVKNYYHEFNNFKSILEKYNLSFVNPEDDNSSADAEAQSIFNRFKERGTEYEERKMGGGYYFGYDYTIKHYFDHLPLHKFMGALAEVGAMRKAYGYEEYLDFQQIANQIVDVETGREIITSVIYTYSSVGLLENHGIEGEDGENTWRQQYDTFIGIESSHETEETTSVALATSVEYSSELSPVEANLETNTSYDYSNASVASQFTEKYYTEEFNIDLQLPCYIY